MYSWSRARTLRLLSLYSRAIYLATLEKQKGHIVGLSTNDASLSFPAASLSHVHDRLHYALFEAEEKSGSDASQFPPKFDEDAGKFVELTSEDRQTLIEHKQIRLKLPPSTPDSIGETLPDFRGCADVRIYRVRFWLDGVRVRKDPNGQAKPVIVDINLTHEGDSIYYDPSGNSHVFSHAPIDVKPSFRVWPSDADGGSARPTAVDNGDIVSRVPRAGMVQKYAAPSPFATWTISLRNVDTNAVDLSKVTRAWFEFFGTSRSFRQTSS